MRVLLAATLVLLLSACGATKYDRGIDDVQIDRNLFKVTFRGNDLTTPERAEELALLRSAELAVKNGFSYFVITERVTRERKSSYTTPVTTSTTARKKGDTVSVDTSTYGGETREYSAPTTINTVVCYTKRPDTQAMVYDAEFLCKSLGQKHKVVCGAR